MNTILKRQFKAELFEQFARVGRAVASPVRLAILDVLAQSERTVEEVAAELGQSVANASQHLRQLRTARLAASRREGQFIYYRLADNGVLRLWQIIREVGESRYAEIDAVVHTYLKDRESMQTVAADELVRLLKSGDVVVLDVRSRAEYAAGHIPAARSMPVGELRKRLQELPKRRRIVAYCRGPYCVFADDAVSQLTHRGYRAARLDIGLPDWKLMGLPVELGCA